MASPWQMIPNSILDEEKRRTEADQWARAQRTQLAQEWLDQQRQQLTDWLGQTLPNVAEQLPFVGPVVKSAGPALDQLGQVADGIGQTFQETRAARPYAAPEGLGVGDLDQSFGLNGEIGNIVPGMDFIQKNVQYPFLEGAVYAGSRGAEGTDPGEGLDALRAGWEKREFPLPGLKGGIEMGTDPINLIPGEPAARLVGAGAKLVAREGAQLAGKIGKKIEPLAQDVVQNMRLQPEAGELKFPKGDIPDAERISVQPAPEALPPMQDNYPKPLSTYASRMYRETSIDDVIPFIDKYTSMDMNLDQVYMSNTPDLALGQGKNKGVIIELDTNKIEGHVNTKKPGWEFTYQNGQAEFIAQYNSQQQYMDAVQSITIKSDAKGGKGWNIRLKKIIADWPKTVNADGSVTYTKVDTSNWVEGGIVPDPKTGKQRLVSRDPETGDLVLGREVDQTLPSSGIPNSPPRPDTPSGPSGIDPDLARLSKESESIPLKQLILNDPEKKLTNEALDALKQGQSMGADITELRFSNELESDAQYILGDNGEKILILSNKLPQGEIPGAIRHELSHNITINKLVENDTEFLAGYMDTVGEHKLASAIRDGSFTWLDKEGKHILDSVKVPGELIGSRYPESFYSFYLETLGEHLTDYLNGNATPKIKKFFENALKDTSDLAKVRQAESSLIPNYATGARPVELDPALRRTLKDTLNLSDAEIDNIANDYRARQGETGAGLPTVPGKPGGGPPSVPPSPPDDLALPGAQGGPGPVNYRSDPTKMATWFRQAWDRSRNVIAAQGQGGEQIAEMLETWRSASRGIQGELENQLAPMLKLSQKEFSQMIDVVEGKFTGTPNLKVGQAAEVWKKATNIIYQYGKQVGVDLAGFRENYFPHMFEQGFFDDKSNWDRAVDSLVRGGMSHEEAVNLMRKSKETIRNRRNGNLELDRFLNLPDYRRDKAVALEYIRNAAERISGIRVFGKDDINVNRLLTQIHKEGFDAGAAQRQFDIAAKARHYEGGDVVGKARTYNVLTKMGLAAISNLQQPINTTAVVGIRRSLKVLPQVFTKEGQEFAISTGEILETVLMDLREGGGYSGKLGKIGAPFFNEVEKFNRTFAALAGRQFSEDMTKAATKGNLRAVKELEKLGLNAEDIVNRSKGIVSQFGDIITVGPRDIATQGLANSGGLQQVEKIKAGQKMVERTQFYVDPQDLPGWASSPLGKLVMQFRTYSYNQTAFMWREIIEPAIKEKDIMPLVRFTMLSVPVSMLKEEVRDYILQQHEDFDPNKSLFEALMSSSQTGIIGDFVTGTLDLSNTLLEGEGLDQSTAENRLVGFALGPTGKSAVDLFGGAVSAVQGKPQNLERFGLRQIPVAGRILSNLVLPYDQKGSETIQDYLRKKNNPGGIQLPSRTLPKAVPRR